MLIQSYVDELTQVTDRLIIASIQRIQAEADQHQVAAEAGNVTREFQDAQARWAEFDEQWKKAKAMADRLLREAQEFFASTGKTSEEIEPVIDVSTSSILLMHRY